MSTPGSHTTRLVTVCNKCLMATCWQGKFMCDDARTAGTVEKTVAELEKLDREHPSYWFIDPATGRVDSQAFADYEGGHISLCECGHSFRQHSKGVVRDLFCRHCPCTQWKPDVSSDENQLGEKS